MNELLTVRQVAEYAGITPQADRNRLPKDLKSYVTTVGKQTMLKKSVLEKYEPKNVGNEIANVGNPTQESIIATIEVLKEQLAVKDRQIADLNERLKAEQTLSQGNQLLLAQKEQQQLEPPQKKSLFKKLFNK
jgi:hypothetical protein